jgi:arylsulfatase A-like enzyme
VIPAQPAPSHHITPGEILLFGIWSGLVGGFGEVLEHIVKYAVGIYTFRGLFVVWAAPVSLAFLCGVAVIPLAILARRGPAKRIIPLMLSLTGWLVLFDVAPPIRGVHWVAQLVLMAGIAMQASNIARKRSMLVMRIVRATIGPLVTAVVLLGVGIPLALRVHEKRVIASLSPSANDVPNVLLLILDTVRAEELSLYGYHRRTSPTLDSLASQGVVYERAYATSSWTMATHASIFTGRLPFETSVGFQTALDETHRTLAEVFDSRGYVTAGFSANTGYVSRESGLARGFAHFEEHRVTLASVLFQSWAARKLILPWVEGRLNGYQKIGRQTAVQVGDAAFNWLERSERSRPYFVFVNFYDAHAPYLPHPPFDSVFTGRRPTRVELAPIPDGRSPVTTQEVMGEREKYDQVILSQDVEISRFLARLEAAGFLTNTILVLASDHGEEFGEWGLLGHGKSLNPTSLHVPLVLVLPRGEFNNTRVSTPISLVDLPATLLALADSRPKLELPGTPLPSHCGIERHHSTTGMGPRESRSNALGHGSGVSSSQRRGWNRNTF